MKRPSDHSSEEENASKVTRFKLREGVVVNSGFREPPAEERVHHKGRLQKRFSNPQDQKNLFYGIIAVIVVLVILVFLELKQLRDRAEEKPSAPVPVEQAQ
jgi:hypothetical protein